MVHADRQGALPATATGARLPTRPWWAVAGTLGAALFGGAALGSAASWLLAPDSHLAGFVGFLTLPLVLGLGYHLWYSRIMSLVARRFGKSVLAALWQVIRRRRPSLDSVMPTRDDVVWLIQRTIQAASSFTHAGMLIGFASGLLVGLVTPRPFWLGLGVFVGLAAAYGRILTRLARSGYLPPPGGE